MQRLSLIVVVLVAALCAAAGASASNPYRFSHRAAVERGMRTVFVGVMRRDQHRRYVVNSIACAKGGVGRVLCAVYATGKLGTQSFTMKVSCPTDALSAKCSYDIEPV